MLRLLDDARRYLDATAGDAPSNGPSLAASRELLRKSRSAI
jgi:hypothetical protein